MVLAVQKVVAAFAASAPVKQLATTKVASVGVLPGTVGGLARTRLGGRDRVCAPLS